MVSFQSDVVHQSVFELIHADDRALFRRQLHFSFNPNVDGAENPSKSVDSELQTSSCFLWDFEFLHIAF